MSCCYKWNSYEQVICVVAVSVVVSNFIYNIKLLSISKNFECFIHSVLSNSFIQF